MRPRDARAILFVVTTSLLVLILSLVLLRNYLASLAILGAWLAIVMTRPRMLRVMRRLRGEPDWSGYYKDR
ncbi:hypothetical protein [Phenylobacterium deserti]|uniref:Uncharacterized protein n=1 Tax=Phenylobacterium deserti TaxID=1914756 RepID=A0A328A8W2_9CAUL|nr:hypothetical protein [Phenylobacterium deserti]RAK50935.1 hypothetical protein DJ018_17370 [Phenylobacterium deserti]